MNGIAVIGFLSGSLGTSFAVIGAMLSNNKAIVAVFAALAVANMAVALLSLTLFRA